MTGGEGDEMQRVRYQVFISSTFRDLQQERHAVLDAILKFGHLPAGMELFPALDATAWDVIKHVIDDSDYYVVVVGGMYGSVDRDGISYTEREYEYARSKEIPILAFLHKDPAAIPADRHEPRRNARRKLAGFRRKLEKRHLCKYWRESDELRYEVAASLTQQINLHPRAGWIRAGMPGIPDMAKAVKDLQSVVDEVAEQRGLREAAERRAQTVEAELSALRKQEADARAEAEQAAVREATAIARGQAAKETLKGLKTEVQADRTHPHREGIPAGFDVTAAKDVLAGVTEGVASFAIWSDTPQGHAFWSEQKKLMENGRSLSSPAREAIVRWVRLAERPAG
jgi:hypothetical protein